MPEAEKKKAIAEFSFTKGILVATFSGIMSACFCLRARGRQSDWRGLTRCGDNRHLERPAQARGGAVGRLHHQLHLVLLP